jgi:hypothetical protein
MRRSVVEQLPAFGRGKIGGDLIEGAPDRVVVAGQSVDREVGGEEAALDAEDRDRVEDQGGRARAGLASRRAAGRDAGEVGAERVLEAP